MSTASELATLPTRERILKAAIRSFQQRGYHGTGLIQILTEARAPKGSLYHHFPNGKSELGVAAIESVAASYEALFTRRRAQGVSAGNIVRAIATAQAEWLLQTQWREGVLFSVLAQGFVADAPELHEALARVYRRRRMLLEQAMREDGGRDVSGVAALTLAALDGGMIQAAAVRDAKPLLLAAERAARCIDQARADLPGRR